jgi:L-alanine-DL-glutamate epimerase-like enolase superfamily enzyme
VQLQLKAFPFQLKFSHPFGIAHGTRDFTDTFYVSASLNGATGYGEAALPPYLGYDVHGFVANFNNWFPTAMDGSEGIQQLFSMLAKNNATLPAPVRAAVDIALYDLCGKLTGKPVRDLLGIPAGESTECTYTLGISSVETMLEKLQEGAGFTIFKLKLGGENDRERILAFKENSTAKFCVDANQAWKSVEHAVEEINFLKSQNCLFVEQPLPVAMVTEMRALFSQSTLPLYLDESIQNSQDFDRLQDCCHGINIKLVKCGGLSPAVELMRTAKRLRKKVLIGCMSESSCGAAAAAQLAGWADYVDLDGPKLISNDPFTGISYVDGIIIPNIAAGTGISTTSLLTEFIK